MKNIIFILLFSASFTHLYAQHDSENTNKRVVSIIDSTNENELVLIQKLDINVPLDSVWNAYTT